MSAELKLDHGQHAEAAVAGSIPARGRLLAIEPDGTLRVQLLDGREFACAWLESPINQSLELAHGDALLVLPATGDQHGDELGVVLGRIGRYRAPQPVQTQPHVTIEAGETLTLKCGEATVDLRKDGKLMIRGEDVLLKAKGTQRIKAGTVNIN